MKDLNGGGNGIARVGVTTTLAEFVVEASARGLRSVTPVDTRGSVDTGGVTSALADEQALAHARAAVEALHRYAAGEPVHFEGPLDVAAPHLHRATWKRLRTVPFGATVTYGEIAVDLGMPGEARAIGAAVGANPVCILVPCHRVVGADGGLRGFAWGLDFKRRLLAHEGSGALSLFG